jgi:hypothetical protein
MFCSSSARMPFCLSSNNNSFSAIKYSCSVSWVETDKMFFSIFTSITKYPISKLKIMKITKILLFATAASQIFFTSCKKSNDASLTASSGINYELKATNSVATINQRLESPQSGTLMWTSGSGSASLIKFEAKTNNNKVEYKSKSLQSIDLFNAINNKLGNITLSPGSYDEVEFKIVLSKTATNAALVLKGQFTSAGVTVPVTFTVDTELEIKAEKNNVVVTDNNSYKALSTIDLSLLTRNITGAMLKNAQLTNGTVAISSTSNATLYAALLSNLNDLDSCEFEHD